MPGSPLTRFSLSRIVSIFSLLLLALLFIWQGISPANAVTDTPSQAAIQGPFPGPTIRAYELNVDLRDLSGTDKPDLAPQPTPLKYVPGTEPKGASETIANWIDSVAQTAPGAGQMPGLLRSFDGMFYGQFTYLTPPDTNGDVSADHYIQTVNASMAIYDKASGAALTSMHLNTFFDGTGTLCDGNNRGDPVVVYDRFADRWLISDFAFTNSGGLYYECIALSQSGDPVSGGWYMWGVPISPSTTMNDYPKVGVWQDGYYFSFNMFYLGSFWDGVQLWAFDKASMLGGVLRSVYFSLGAGTGYASLLPAHALSEPPESSLNYFASLAPPDELQIWKFHADWDTPASSTLSGPTLLNVAEFAIAPSVPQKNSSFLLDSLSYRPMMQLIYRQVGGVEALWVNHTVASQGVGGVRWYEVRNPAGTPSLFQQGTYQPDMDHRWMGSLAVDQDGNMAVGYSVSSANMYPAIRYSGRLAGEKPGELHQGESILIQGSGSQISTTRWGDYSAMSVDPSDDCTFWYTNEYYATSGGVWRTRIGAFKFPSCGQPKGGLVGTVRDSDSLQPIPAVQVVASAAPTQTLTTLSDSNGKYTMTLTAGIYTLVAGPALPGYPISSTVDSVVVTSGFTTTQDLLLDPAPYLVEAGLHLDDNPPSGNGNGYPEPGESGLLLWEGLTNSGVMTSTGITAHLESLTPGVTISATDAIYPDIAPGQTLTNTTAFEFSISPIIPCGTDLQFHKTITDSHSNYNVDFVLNAAIPLPRETIFTNDVESGLTGWTTGGTKNSWAITTFNSHSPTHAWTDSPSGNYLDNTNSFLRTPVYDLSGMRRIQIGAWIKYRLEPGYDFVYLDYSLDGGVSWSENPSALLALNGYQEDWKEFTINAPALDGQSNVALRFRLVSDGGVTDDGIYIDDIVLSYEPYDCTLTILRFPLIFNNYSQ